MSNAYDDSIWELIPTDDRPLDDGLVARMDAFLAGADSVLDLGCGDGQYLSLLAGHCSDVYGADHSQVAIDRAAGRAPSANLSLVGDDYRLKLPDNCLSRIWCVDTIEHVVDTQTFLSEARRVLAPGGRIFVATPSHSWKLRLKLAVSGWSEHFDPFGQHLRFYTARTLRYALSECGFEVDDVDAENGSLFALATRR